MIPLLEELYKEIEHGDVEHRKWLWDKIEDFSNRKTQENERETEIIPVCSNTTYQDYE